MRNISNHEHPLIKNTKNNPQINILHKNKQTLLMPNKSPIIHRRAKNDLEESICFISPKKIAFFQSIDESCLNQSQKVMVKQQSLKTANNVMSLNLKQREKEIDYRSIKKCLSPRSNIIHNQAEQETINQSKHKQKQNQSQKVKHEDIQFYQKLILDLKMEILEISQLLEEKEKNILEKNNKIAFLQREIYKEQNNQAIYESIKSISTSHEERTISTIDTLPFLTFEQNNDKIFELQQKIMHYQHQLKRYQIEIDVLKKYRFEKHRYQSQMAIIMKKNESLKRKVDRLNNKNHKLLQEINKFKHEKTVDDERSVILEFSPQKFSIQ